MAESFAEFGHCFIIGSVCFVHLGALVVEELNSSQDVTNPMVSLCQLLRCQDYAASWKVAMGIAAAKKLTTVRCSIEDRGCFPRTSNDSY